MCQVHALRSLPAVTWRAVGELRLRVRQKGTYVVCVSEYYLLLYYKNFERVRVLTIFNPVEAGWATARGRISVKQILET